MDTKYNFKKDAALKYYESGLTVIPVWKFKKNPITNWRNEKICNKEEIELFWGDFTLTGRSFRNGNPIKGNQLNNIAIETGIPVEEGYNLIVLDLDLEKYKEDDGKTIISKDQSESGLEKIKDLELRLGKLPDTVTQTTGSGGKQLFFKYRDNLSIKNGVNIVKNIDIRAEGGLVLVPPSKTDFGAYKWDKGKSIFDIDIAELPETWINFILEKFKEDNRKEFKRNYKSASGRKEKELNSKPDTNVGLIRSWRVEELQKKIFGKEPEKILVNSQEELSDMIGQLDLQLILGVSQNFSCLFHEDNNPSAVIFRNSHSTGKIYSYYFCNSCETKGSIWSILEKATGWYPLKIKQFLMELFNIEIIKTEEQEDIINIVEHFESLYCTNILEVEVPLLSKRLRYTFKQYIEILNFAKLNYLGIDKNGYVVFFSSMRNLGKILEYKNISKINNRLNHLILLELFHKYTEEEIREIDGDLKDKLTMKNGKRTSLLGFKLPTMEALKHAEGQQEILDELDFFSDSYTIEGIQRRLGIDITKQIFPQSSDKELSISDSSRILTSYIIDIIFKEIELKGYCLREEIFEILSKGYKRRTVENQLKLSMRDICYVYGLKYMKLNKILKKDLNCKVPNYPKVFLKD